MPESTDGWNCRLLGNYSLASFHLEAESGGGTGTVVTDPPLTSGSVIAPPLG